jgi:hypothetical protein
LGTTNTGGRQMMVGAGGFQLGTTGGESALTFWGISAELKNVNRKAEKNLFTVSPFL